MQWSTQYRLHTLVAASSTSDHVTLPFAYVSVSVFSVNVFPTLLFHHVKLRLTRQRLHPETLRYVCVDDSVISAVTTAYFEAKHVESKDTFVTSRLSARRFSSVILYSGLLVNLLSYTIGLF